MKKYPDSIDDENCKGLKRKAISKISTEYIEPNGKTLVIEKTVYDDGCSIEEAIVHDDGKETQQSSSSMRSIDNNDSTLDETSSDWCEERDRLLHAFEKFFIHSKLTEDNYHIYKAYLIAKSSESQETNFTLKELARHSSLNLSIPETCIHPIELDNIRHYKATEELREEVFNIKAVQFRKSRGTNLDDGEANKDIVDGFTFIMIDPLSTESFIMIVIFFIQITSAFLAISNNYLDSEADNGFLNQSKILIPKGVEQVVHVGQGIAIPVVAIVSDQLWEGVISFIKGYNNHYRNQGITYVPWLVANAMRIILGLTIYLATFILIITSDNVVDLLKDFTAMVFIASFDNLILVLASIGIMGPKFQKTAERCMRITYKQENYERRDTSTVSRCCNLIRKFLSHPLLSLLI